MSEVKKAGESANPKTKTEKFVIHCKAGIRSVIAQSILERQGFTNVVSVDKGIDGLIAKNVKTVPMNKAPSSSL